MASKKTELDVKQFFYENLPSKVLNFQPTQGLGEQFKEFLDKCETQEDYDLLHLSIVELGSNARWAQIEVTLHQLANLGEESVTQSQVKYRINPKTKDKAQWLRDMFVEIRPVMIGADHHAIVAEYWCSKSISTEDAEILLQKAEDQRLTLDELEYEVKKKANALGQQPEKGKATRDKTHHSFKFGAPTPEDAKDPKLGSYRAHKIEEFKAYLGGVIDNYLEQQANSKDAES